MIAVVTDSTCDTSPEIAKAGGVRIVPLTVRFGDEQFRDGVDITAKEFYERLTTGTSTPSTSQPSPEAFSSCYKELLDGGADGIVSVHISGQLSGTLQSATLAARDFPGKVEVVDTASVSAGLQMAVDAASKAAHAGADLAGVAAAASSTAERGGLFVLLDTLTYLQRGGRIGKAQAFMGGLLNVKPVLQIKEGLVHPESRVRSRSQGMARLVELVSQSGPIESATIMYTTTPDLAEELRPRIQAVVGDGVEVKIGEIGPVVGTYGGPGALGVAFVRAQLPG
jgi:fatty acid kinase fatty acid binding subunit